MEVKPEQPEKTPPPIDVTDSGIVKVVKDVQAEKTLSPIVVTEDGISKEVKPVHP